MSTLNVNRIFCLSLDKDEHRRKRLLAAFPIIKDRIEFVSGLDGNLSPITVPSWISNLRPHQKYLSHVRSSVPVLNYTLSNKELACVLGHMQIWRDISELDNDRPCLVCEDDIFPNNAAAFIEIANNIIDQMKREEIVYLGYSSYRGESRSKIYTLAQKLWHWFKQRRFSGSLQSTVSYNLVRKATPRTCIKSQLVLHAGLHWGAFCYLITRHSAKQLLALNANLEMTSDGTLRYANLSQAIPIYISKKSLVQVNTQLGSNIRTQEEHNSNFSKFKIS